MFSLLREVNEEPPVKYEPNKEKRKHEDFKWLKEVYQYTHEYVYHHVTSEDVSTNNNFLQSYNSSPKCGMKFLQIQIE